MKFKAIFFAGLSITTLGFAVSPLPASADIKQEDLKGYTCELSGIGFTVCTKSGSETYWCDAANKCTVAPVTIQVPKNDPKGRFPVFSGGQPQVQTGK